MNTIKFTEITGISTERHNPSEENSKAVDLFGLEKKISVPTNLNILITYGCNCRCGFCITEQEEKLPAITDEEYMYRLDRVLKQLQGIPIEITITGGEPALYPERLIPVLKMVHDYGFPHRTFSTNGTGLLVPYQNKPVLQHMKESEVFYNINLSRLHMDEKTNEMLMHGTTVSITDMKQISSFCDINDMDIRLSCNLMKHGISDFESMYSYIRSAEDIGFHNIVFRELVNCEKEYIDIKPLMDRIRKDKTFLYLETIENSSYKIEVYQFFNYIVRLYETNKKPSDTLTTLVYREGLLSHSWKTDYFFEV